MKPSSIAARQLRPRAAASPVGSIPALADAAAPSGGVLFSRSRSVAAFVVAFPAQTTKEECNFDQTTFHGAGDGLPRLLALQLRKHLERD